MSKSISNTEILKIVIKIAGIVIIMRSILMVIVLPILALAGIKLSLFWENLLVPFILAGIVSPIIGFWIIGPYVRERDQAFDFAKAEHIEKEAFLSDQSKTLEKVIERATLDLKKTQERYEFVEKATNDGLWDWDVSSDSIYFSPRWKGMIGFNDADFPNDRVAWLTRIHPDDRDWVASILDFASKLDSETTGECVYQVLHKDEYYIWVQMQWIHIQSVDGARVLGAQTDITEKKKMEEQLIHDSLHDGLTGLPNRNLLHDRISQNLIRFKRDANERFVLLFIDVDNFKRINDTLGHLVGDQVLIKLSERLLEVCRESDTVARLGGDEFAILMPYYQSQKKLEETIKRLLAYVNKPLKLSRTTVNANISIGVVVSEMYHRNAHPEKILMDADLALYRTKEYSKGSYSIFDLKMRDKMSEQFEIGNSLDQALAEDEIMVFYQPIVDVGENVIKGFEALVRWKHPKHGWISPASFIPIAEESEFIHKLGHYVVDQALFQLQEWNDLFKRKDWLMSINVSGRQFDRQDLIAYLKDGLEKFKIAPSQLQIELTETILSVRHTELEDDLKSLKEMGIKLAIDDFGTGISSLSTFFRYPFDTIKIDKSFVDDIETSERSKIMVNLVQTLAKTMSIQTVAEGVESFAQIEMLRRFGCHYIQGYYFSKPLDAVEMTQLLSENMNPANWNISEGKPLTFKKAS